MVEQIENLIFAIVVAVWLGQELTPRMYEITYRRYDGKIVTEWCFQQQADKLLRELEEEKYFSKNEGPTCWLVDYEIVKGVCNWRRCMVWQEIVWGGPGSGSAEVRYNRPLWWVAGD